MPHQVPAFQLHRYLLPPVAQLPVHLEQPQLFLIAPNLFVDCGVEMVIPPFAALLAGALGVVFLELEAGGHGGPVVQAQFPHYLSQDQVFLRSTTCTFLVQFLRIKYVIIIMLLRQARL